MKNEVGFMTFKEMLFLLDAALFGGAATALGFASLNSDNFAGAVITAVFTVIFFLCFVNAGRKFLREVTTRDG